MLHGDDLGVFWGCFRGCGLFLEALGHFLCGFGAFSLRPRGGAWMVVYGCKSEGGWCFFTLFYWCFAFFPFVEMFYISIIWYICIEKVPLSGKG